jgi:hypothetical protein
MEIVFLKIERLAMLKVDVGSLSNQMPLQHPHRAVGVF